MSFQPTDIAYVDIFPPVGIARLGNSPDQYYIGPEVPDQKDPPAGGFKDSNGFIKRQAARFRVYAFDNQNNVLGEVNAAGGYGLTWTAHVANTKSAGHTFKQRYDDPPNQLPDSWKFRNPSIQGADRIKLAVNATGSVTGTNASPVPLRGTFQSTGPQIPVYLGELQTDNEGRLLYLGGRGTSIYAKNPELADPPLPDFADNDDWVDDTSDGSITVTVTHSALQGPLAPKYGAWVVTGAPKFSWAVRSPVTLYDLMENIYPQDPSRLVDFFRDIWPIFYCTSALSWVDKDAQTGHSPGTSEGYDFLENKTLLQSPAGSIDDRNDVFNYIRPDVTADMNTRIKFAKSRYMPRLSGDAVITTPPRTMVPGQPDTFLCLTTLQYKRLQAWRDGKFQTGNENYWPSSFDAISPAEQPSALTLAALQWVTGGSFHPGIEVWWRSALPDWYLIGPGNNGFPQGVPPFRIDLSKVNPGDLTQGMAIPWQGDFFDCGDGWWPSARPEYTMPQVPDPNVDSPRDSWARGVRDGVQNIQDDDEAGRVGMVKNFYRLAYIVPLPGVEIRMEEGRDPKLPDHPVPRPTKAGVTGN